MRIEYSKNFIKDFKHCPNNVRNNFKLRLEIFIKNKNYSLYFVAIGTHSQLYN